MEEVFEKIQLMLSQAFNQGMAYQRQLDANDEFNHHAAEVQGTMAEIRTMLVPNEEERMQ